MNIKSIDYFLVVAEEMNITKAAERLYISQQALSSHIKRLEEEYGVTLFERKPVFRLTREGKEMEKYGRQILESEAHMQASFSDISTNCKATIAVGISRLRGNVFFPDMWKYYHASHPNISIELIDGNSNVFNDMLMSGKLDLYLSVDPPTGALQNRIDLAKEHILCCFTKELLQKYYPDTWEDIISRSKKHGLDLNDVIKLPFATMRNKNRLRECMNQYFLFNPSPEFVFECNQQDVIYSLVKDGSVAGLLSPILFYSYQHERDELGDDFFIFPLTNKITGNTVSLVYRRDYPLPRYTMDFISTACMVMKRYANLIEAK